MIPFIITLAILTGFVPAACVLCLSLSRNPVE